MMRLPKGGVYMYVGRRLRRVECERVHRVGCVWMLSAGVGMCVCGMGCMWVVGECTGNSVRVECVCVCLCVCVCVCVYGIGAQG